MSTTFVTTRHAVYIVNTVTPQQAADHGCPDATHVLRRNDGEQWCVWAPTTGREVSMRYPGWARWKGMHGRFWSWWNNDAVTAVTGHLVVASPSGRRLT